VLQLDLSVQARLSKKRGYEDSDDVQSVLTVHRHVGPWNAAEIELFKTGVNRHGWGEWSQIAGLVQTRDRDQVRGYSRSVNAQKYRYATSLVPALSNLAEGLNNMSKCLTDT
jgi:hypothetical protein